MMFPGTTVWHMSYIHYTGINIGMAGAPVSWVQGLWPGETRVGDASTPVTACAPVLARPPSSCTYHWLDLGAMSPTPVDVHLLFQNS
jgi:hypothetical protein